MGDEGAAVLLDADEPFIGERLQGGAHQRAADIEEFADIAFGKLGAGGEPPLDDRIAQRVADMLTASVGGGVCGHVGQWRRGGQGHESIREITAHLIAGRSEGKRQSDAHGLRADNCMFP
ncbi:hypothetical protein D9M72_633580 [compost metagenome]